MQLRVLGLLVLPVALVTWVVTALWWFAGSAAATAVVRNPLTPKAVEGTALGLVLLCVLPLVTRLCVAVLVGLGPALLGEAAALHRRIAWPGHAAMPADPGPAALYRRIGLPARPVPTPVPAPGPLRSQPRRPCLRSNATSTTPAAAAVTSRWIWAAPSTLA
jgi:hypothetical protein